MYYVFFSLKPWFRSKPLAVTSVYKIVIPYTIFNHHCFVIAFFKILNNTLPVC